MRLFMTYLFCLILGGSPLLTAKTEQVKESMPYTFVLTPPTDHAFKYIEASQQLYGHLAPFYLLNAEGTSSPHITVVQFKCDSPQQAQEVWESMCIKMREKRTKRFAPPFTGLAFIEGNGPYTGTTWIELSVKRGQEDSPIMHVHNTALEVLEAFGITPLNATKSDYRPHLTLARIVLPSQIQTWPKELFENTAPFKLEFGRSDEEWQYAETLAIFHSENE